MPDSPNDDFAPATSVGFLTPRHSPPTNPRIIDGNSHHALSSLSSMPSPEGPREDDFKPLLPAHNPLRKHLSLLRSPPHSPKGHPARPNLKKHVILNPYTPTRVPRRLRPLLFFVGCFVIVGMVFLSRALSHASNLDLMIAQRKTDAMERRIVHVDGLVNINPPQSEFSFDNNQDELLALINFITSTTSNALPPMDPSYTLDPEAILDFDPNRASANDDFALLRTEINTLYPIVLFGKMRDPWHREMKLVLAEYKITPAPLIVDVDQRRDHLLFIPLLARLFDSDQLPQLVLLGKSLGSYHDVLAMKESGMLRDVLEDSGHVAIQDAKVKKKGIKERERLEMERVLGPAPIVE